MIRPPVAGSVLIGVAFVAFSLVSVANQPQDPTVSVPATAARSLPSAMQLDVTAAPPAGDLAIGAPPAEFHGAPPPVVAPPSHLAAPPTTIIKSGGTWAVLIGINDYPGARHDLRSAVSDILDVDLLLAASGVAPSRRLVLTDGQATANNIRRSMRWVVDRAGPEANVVIAFAGHVRELDSATQAMIGSDGGEVRDTELASLLAPLQARSAWIVIAACYGGGFTELLAPGRVLTAAAPAGSLAYENSSFGRSYLAEFMVRRTMLEGGERSVVAAFAIGSQAIEQEYPNRMPVQYSQHQGDLVIGESDARGPAPDRSSSPPNSGSTSSPSRSSRSSPTTTTAPNRCEGITLGVVRC